MTETVSAGLKKKWPPGATVLCDRQAKIDTIKHIKAGATVEGQIWRKQYRQGSTKWPPGTVIRSDRQAKIDNVKRIKGGMGTEGQIWQKLNFI